MAKEVRDLASQRTNITTHFAYSQPDQTDVIGVNYDSIGRISGELLASLIDSVEAQYFLCGPTTFMASVQAELEARSIPLDHIHTETFGPSG